MENTMKHAQPQRYYVTKEQDAIIGSLAKRIGVSKSKCVRICMVTIAENPVLEYIISNGVLLNTCDEVFYYYLSMIEVIDEALERLEKQCIDIEIHRSKINIEDFKKFKEDCYSILEDKKGTDKEEM